MRQMAVSVAELIATRNTLRLHCALYKLYCTVLYCTTELRHGCLFEQRHDQTASVRCTESDVQTGNAKEIRLSWAC